MGLNGRKRDFQEPRIVLHSFDLQKLSFKLISSFNEKVRSKAKLSTPIGLNKAL